VSSPILRVTTRILVLPLLVLGVYLLWRGHDAPGGGFIAALVFSVALALRALTDPPDNPLSFPPAGALLGIGLLLSLLAAVVPMFLGAPLMTAYDTHLHPFGLDLHLTTSLIFDSGVAFIVVGLLRGMIDALEFPDVGGTGEHEGEDLGSGDAFEPDGGALGLPIAERHELHVTRREDER
jgi:multicomponent Na+:H+ antiporter subunit A